MVSKLEPQEFEVLIVNCIKYMGHDPDLEKIRDFITCQYLSADLEEEESLSKILNEREENFITFFKNTGTQYHGLNISIEKLNNEDELNHIIKVKEGDLQLSSHPLTYKRAVKLKAEIEYLHEL